MKAQVLPAATRQAFPFLVEPGDGQRRRRPPRSLAKKIRLKKPDTRMNRRMSPHHKRRRAVAAMVAFGVGGLLVGLIVWEPVITQSIVEHPYLTVQEIRVELGDPKETAGRISPSEVQEWSGVRVGMPLLKVDPWQIEARLISHPWIRGAQVELELPQRVYLRVQMRQPVAIIRRAEPTYLDQNGEFFLDPTWPIALDLPYVSGLDGLSLESPTARQALAGVYQLLTLTQLWPQPLSETHWSEQQGFTLFLAERQATIWLGWETVPDKLVQVGRVLEAWPEDGPAAVFDARFANQVIVRPFSDSAASKGEENYV